MALLRPKFLLTSMLLLPLCVLADAIEYKVTGIDEPMLSNVRNHVASFRVGRSARLTARLQRRLVEDAQESVANAMRPYGYFHTLATTEIIPDESGKWILSIAVEAGPPVLVDELQLELTGPGSSLESLQSWYSAFPLRQGMRLDQHAWDQAKLRVTELLEEEGYLLAQFSRHVIRVDPVANTANLELVVDTGPQVVMGSVSFNQEFLDTGVLESIRHFSRGDPYNVLLLEKFQLDLWQSGYFEEIELVERRQLDATPPRVNLEVNFKARKKNTYQGTLGYGTDTLARVQLLWGRHLLSPRGDNLDVGFGWQQQGSEFSLQSNYRLPRMTESQQFWIATLGLSSEQQEVEISASGDLENRFNIADGTVNNYSLRLGKIRVRNMRAGFEQMLETVFVQYLHEANDFTPTGIITQSASAPIERILERNVNSLTVGMDWNWPGIHGSGFSTTGHHQRAWAFTSNTAWGSEADFSQVYLSSRWNLTSGDHWKFLLRAEAGYSDARIDEISVPVEDIILTVETTELPNLYRFKAGGSRSVRGYGFETLDTNGVGSNSILSASAEVEYNFREDWSVAAFIDIGNAFNDWGKTDLKRGTGLGIRWYSVIGSLRLDVAQAWDLEGDPWRIHLTIGTPLL